MFFIHPCSIWNEGGLRVFDVGFFVARSDYDGQCEGLRLWDGRRVRFPRLFLYPLSKGTGGIVLLGEIMHQTYCRPVFHIFPNAPTVLKESLASLPLEELKSVLRQCKDAEDERVYCVNPDIIVRQVGNEWLLVPTGEYAQRFNGMISLNEFSYFIWQQFETPHTLKQALDAANEEFLDVEHTLEIEVRRLVYEYVNMNLFCEV